MPLTPDERHTLTALERQLREEAPALALALARGPQPRWRILRTRQVALLVGALSVLAASGQAVDDRFGALGLGLLTASLIVPWLITSAWAGSRRDAPAPGTHAPGSDGDDALAGVGPAGVPPDAHPSTSPRRGFIWATAIELRVLAFLLLTVGVLTSITLLVLAAFAVFAIAQLSWLPSTPRPTTADGDDHPPSPQD